MTKLEELINSLATIIVRYHDTQRGITKLVVESEPSILRKKSSEHAIGIMQNAEAKFDQKLRELIDACTKGYADRKHFLTFILNEIIFLKTQLDRKTAFTPEELGKFQQQITQFLIDCRELLKTQKAKSYKVTYSSLDNKDITRIDLNGLINDAYIGNHFCNSGLLLIDEILERFHMDISFSDEQIRDIASGLCLEYQKATLELQKSALEAHKSTLNLQKSVLEARESTFKLQESELEAQKSALELQKSELEARESTLKRQESELENQKSTLELQKSELEAEKFTLELQQSELKTQKSTLDLQKSELEVQKLNLTEKNKIQQITVDKLHRDLEKTQAEFEKFKSKFENFEKQKAAEVQKLKSEFEDFKKQKAVEGQKLKSEFDDFKKQKAVEGQQLKSELEDFKKQKAVEVQKLKSELEDSKKQKAEVQKLKSELEDTIKQKEEEVQKLKSELENSKKQKTEEPSQLVKRAAPVFPLYGSLASYYRNPAFFQPDVLTKDAQKEVITSSLSTNLE